MLKRYLNTPYEIDEDGQCYSHRSKKFLKPQTSGKYPTYNLTIDGKKKKVKIHRMVAETFLPKIEGKEYVNHIDGDTHNYKLENLEWCTARENSRHAIDTGLRRKGDQTINKYIEDLPGETWVNMNDYPNYAISSKGRIMNIRSKRLLKQVIGNNGYYEVNLWKNNKSKTTQIHRIVYSYFNSDYDLKGYVINHINGNKLDNNLKNLEKITYKENNLRAEYIIKTHKCGKPVEQLDENFNIIASYSSISEAQRVLQISNIGRAIKQHTKVLGYYWRLKNNESN